jgi:hypothetical protein
MQLKINTRAHLNKFMIYASKFNLVLEILWAAFHANDNDMLYKDLTHPDWDKFFKVYDFYESKDLVKFNKQYKNL